MKEKEVIIEPHMRISSTWETKYYQDKRVHLRNNYPKETEFGPKEPDQLSSTLEEPVLTHEQGAYPAIPAE